jgi:2-polyprenyl-3-methyl-5-hydroxy-6-metoxy-1,4-benzoquinol methylase
MANVTNDENIKQWSNAPREFIKVFGESGDFARQFLLNSVIFKLLGDPRGKMVLDAGCGQGYLSRLLAKHGALVTGIEPAEPFINYATEQEQLQPLSIKYIQADLSIFDMPLPAVDAVIANMVLMDIPDYQNAIRNCLRLLREGGSFVFSISHPCFEGSSSDYKAKGHLEIKEYFQEYSIQQRFGYAVHRPLSHYINTVIQSGGRIVEVVEPQLDITHAQAALEYERDLHVPSFIVLHAMRTYRVPHAHGVFELEL